MAGTITAQRTAEPASLWRYFPRAMLAIGIVLYAFILVRTAWLCDDAYITFRTVDNFIHGYGLTWNTFERVQAYTHPLWMFVLSGFYYVTREIYFTSLFVSMGVSLAAVLVFVSKVARCVPQAILGLTILLLSKAFVDFSTSGLENPLSFLLLAVFLAVYLQDTPVTIRRLTVLSLVASLGILNRMDILLLFAPALLHGWWTADSRTGHQSMDCGTPATNENATSLAVLRLPEKHGLRPSSDMAEPARAALGRRLAAVIPGFVPFIAWEIFSVTYYGFLFPNTAYAKLNTGIPAMDLAGQGLKYSLNSLVLDPLTLLTMLCAVTVAFALRKPKPVMVATGILLYLLYIVRIGGDFMSGRFLAAPLFCAVMILGAIQWRMSAWRLVVLLAVAIGLGFGSPAAKLCFACCFGRKYVSRLLWPHDISDARTVYYPHSGLLRANRVDGQIDHWWVQEALYQRQFGPKVSICGGIGFRGYFAGPDIRIIDFLALSDPLLARLPAESIPDWRIGHFRRTIPKGYIETLESGEIEIADAKLAAYYDKLRLITQAPLFSKGRWQAIWDMNRGKLNRLIDTQAYRFPKQVHTSVNELAGLFRSATASQESSSSHSSSTTQPAMIRFSRSGILVRLGQLTRSPSMVSTLTDNTGYQITWLRGKREIAKAITRTPRISTGNLVSFRVGTPEAAIREGYDALRIQPLHRDKECGLAHVQLRCGSR